MINEDKPTLLYSTLPYRNKYDEFLAETIW